MLHIYFETNFENAIFEKSEGIGLLVILWDGQNSGFGKVYCLSLLQPYLLFLVEQRVSKKCFLNFY